MKTKIFLGIVIFIIFSIEVSATCPNGTGWVQQPTLRLPYTYPDNSECEIMISWCKRPAGLNPYGALCEIYIGEIFIKQECYNSNYSIDIRQIYERLANSGEIAGCLGSEIPICPTQSLITVIYSNGGCYYYTEEWILEDDGLAHGYIVAHPCDPNTAYYCKSYYSICKEFVDGKWVYRVTNGPAAPTFQCSEGCDSICQ